MRQLLTDLRGNPISFTARRRQRRYRHPNLPALFYLVQNRSWDEAVRRARTHPHEVLIQEDLSGNTPLHIACRLDPPADIVRSLLPSSTLKNAEGSTALHVAATHRCSADVIRVLLETTEADDGTVSPTACLTRMGRAPIHFACMSFRGLGIDAFRALLEATITHGNIIVPHNADFDFIDEDEEEDILDGTTEKEPHVVNVMTMRDCTGQTPLGLLFRRYRERVRCVIKAVEQLQTEHTGSAPMASLAAAITVQADLGELWEKARIIVGRLTEERLQREGVLPDLTTLHSPGEEAVAHEAAAWAAERYRRVLQEGQPHATATVGARQFRIVHASVGLTGYGCPPEMIRLAISIHPHQVREMDEDGNLPIHIAAVASSYVTSSNNSDAPTTTQPSDEDSLISDMSFLSSATTGTKAFDKVIKILLSHYPAAIRIPHGRTGHLPLMLAIQARRRTWEDGLKALLDGFPPALESRRIPMNLYPSILALIGNRDGCPFIEGIPRSNHHHGSIVKTNRGLTTLYELVKAKPDVVKRVL